MGWNPILVYSISPALVAGLASLNLWMYLTYGDPLNAAVALFGTVIAIMIRKG